MLKAVAFIRLSFARAYPPERRRVAVMDRTALAGTIAVHAPIMVVLLNGSTDDIQGPLMRKAILILAYLFSALSVFGQSDLSRPELKIEYDRFRDSTSATLSSSYTRSQSGTTLIGFVATVPGQSMKGKTPDVDLVIAHMSDDWMFINGPRTLRVILSDKDRKRSAK